MDITNFFGSKVKEEKPDKKVKKKKEDAPKTYTIKSVLTKLNNLISKEELFQTLTMECYVKGIKRYEWATYFELYDDSGTVNGYILSRSIHEEFKENTKLKFLGVLKVDKLNKVSIGIVNYSIVDTKVKGRYELVYDMLKKEGLLDEEKCHIHNNYKNIGLITSTNAAGLKDILSTLRKNMSNGNIIIYPTLVQGTAMAPSIIKKIQQANEEKRCDIILIARGGGSKSDLEWFDDYDLAKSVIESEIPTACGIGHEIDKTIIDLVVDKSFITPTDAANKLTNGQLDYKHKMDNLVLNYNQIVNHIVSRLDTYTYTYSYAKKQVGRGILSNVDRLINRNNAICYTLANRVNRLMVRYEGRDRILYDLVSALNRMEGGLANYDQQIEEIKETLSKYQKDLDSVKKPTVISNKKSITSKKELMEIIKKGDKVKIKFLDGEVSLDSLKS